MPMLAEDNENIEIFDSSSHKNHAFSFLSECGELSKQFNKQFFFSEIFSKPVYK